VGASVAGLRGEASAPLLVADPASVVCRVLQNFRTRGNVESPRMNGDVRRRGFWAEVLLFYPPTIVAQRCPALSKSAAFRDRYRS
jgi:hypothetical protein